MVERSEAAGEIDGVPLAVVAYGEVTGLPDPAPGVVVVVSAMVRAACPDRADLASPGEPVRDEAGRVIGCRSLVVNRPAARTAAEWEAEASRLKEAWAAADHQADLAAFREAQERKDAALEAARADVVRLEKAYQDCQGGCDDPEEEDVRQAASGIAFSRLEEAQARLAALAPKGGEW